MQHQSATTCEYFYQMAKMEGPPFLLRAFILLIIYLILSFILFQFQIPFFFRSSTERVQVVSKRKMMVNMNGIVLICKLSLMVHSQAHDSCFSTLTTYTLIRLKLLREKSHYY